jgi:hypothetical protein
MRVLTLCACLMAALFLTVAVPLAADAALSERVTARVGPEAVFLRFGESVALSARHGRIGDANFRAAWEAVTRKAFAARGLDGLLAERLESELDDEELAAIDSFFSSELGQRIGALEAAVQHVPADAQIAVIAKGQALLLKASPARQRQLQQVFALGSADVTFAMLRESLRGLALGLHLARGGDLTVPWEEIDAAVAAELFGMEASLKDASLGTLAYALEPLTDDELAAYLSFLSAPGTQKFQALTALTIGRAIQETMGRLGTAVADRLSAVAI